MNESDAVIVGAGPAGLAAAAVLARAGVATTLLDDNARPGGQYFRQPATGFGRAAASPFDSDPAVAARLFEVMSHPRVRWIPGATAWDLPEPGTVAFAAGADSGRVKGRVLLLATGASDRPVPFPGWTLPGVLTAGGLQNLVKGQRVLPGRRFVVAGTGPLLLAVAHNLLSAGADVAAVVEAAPLTRNLLHAGAGFAAAPALLARGIGYRAALYRRRVPLLESHVVTSAQGAREVESVAVAPLGPDGRPQVQRRRVIACDTLVTGFGLAPATELARLAGCALAWDARLGARVPRRDGTLQSSVAGTWIAGDNANLGGAACAMAEGEVAAHAMLAALGVRPAVLAARRASMRLARARRFRDALARLWTVDVDWLSLATPETAVCRCEGVTRSVVERAMADGAGVAAIKSRTRCGLGRCQGRFCLPTLTALVARRQGVVTAAVEAPRPRPPARPVAIEDLLHEPLPPPDLPDDPHLPRRRR